MNDVTNLTSLTSPRSEVQAFVLDSIFPRSPTTLPFFSDTITHVGHFQHCLSSACLAAASAASGGIQLDPSCRVSSAAFEERKVEWARIRSERFTSWGHKDATSGTS